MKNVLLWVIVTALMDNKMHREIRDDPMWQKAQQCFHHCTKENKIKKTLEFNQLTIDLADCLLSWVEEMTNKY